MAYSVSFVTKYIRSVLESDLRLSNIEVEGEISNITYGNHVYFTLKDETGVLSCVMFKSYAGRLKIHPGTGERVIVKGSITVYPPRGSYQLNVTDMKPCGQGELYRRFLELKDSLEEKGMFDASYKRPIPQYINTLGVVTSPTGAAVRDIINITRRRNPYVRIILYPSLVQGEGAAENIAEGISVLDGTDCDVIIIGRGGGSMEDLWAFNEEIVANAVFACNTPVISAVGHETDVSISDFVADLRAPTPSAAAELAVYDVYDLLEELDSIKAGLKASFERNIEDRRQRALNMKKRLYLLSPYQKIQSSRTRLQHIREFMQSTMESGVERSRARLSNAATGLHALSPAIRLSQGYSYITDKSGHNIKSISQIKEKDRISVKLSDGDFEAEVNKIKKD